VIQLLAQNWTTTLVAVLWLSVIALAGGLLTDVGPWYESLRFPKLRPPNWLFGPAWTLIYVFVAVGAVLAYDAAEGAQRWVLIGLFLVNSAFNVAWSPLFFKLRRPDWALAEWVPFWLSVAAIVAYSYEVRPFAAAFLGVYLAWVTFAGWLNWRIVALNAPFGRARR
jgi:tryptophan-rich sensory protein